MERDRQHIILQSADQLNGNVAATIGFFDGVHLGHRFLIRELTRIAHERGLISCAITFDKHPRIVVQSDYQPRLLNSFDEKMERLAETEIDYCVVLNFTREMAALSARDFIRYLATEWKTKLLLIGHDHRFGHNREDGFDEYVAYGKEAGVEIVQTTPFYQGTMLVSSSKIRSLLEVGDVATAALLLSYPYMLKGTVVEGHRVGRKLGFPTANIRLDEPCKMIPEDGVYAVWVYVRGQRYPGMFYIGRRPTMQNGHDRSLEVNILDFNESIYNIEIEISFMHYIRGDRRFDSPEQLIRQMNKDRNETRRHLF